LHVPRLVQLRPILRMLESRFQATESDV